MKICRHHQTEHLKISKTAKFEGGTLTLSKQRYDSAAKVVIIYRRLYGGGKVCAPTIPTSVKSHDFEE